MLLTLGLAMAASFELIRIIWPYFKIEDDMHPEYFKIK